MDKEQQKDKIIEIVKKAIDDNSVTTYGADDMVSIDGDDVDHIAEEVAENVYNFYKPIDNEMNTMCNIDDIVRGFIVKDGKIMYVTNILNGCRQEFKDIHKICDELNNNMKEIDRLMEWNNYLRFQLEEIQKLTVKEFAAKLKKNTHNYYPSIDSYCCSRHVVLVKDIDELLKEYEE